MKKRFYLWLTLILALIPAVSGADTANLEILKHAPYPRIANCYGSNLQRADDDQINSYLSKLDLIIGVGGYDFHTDWNVPQGSYYAIRNTILKLKHIKPAQTILPYVDVIEGPFNKDLPDDFWMLDEHGNKLSTWPGYYRIKTDRKDVLEYIYERVRTLILEKPDFDGIFYDCWKPDPILTSKTIADFPKSIVMINNGDLPDNGYEKVNGALSEDELNRVLDGKIDYDTFLTRYINWTKKSREPHVTTIVCHPRTMNDNPWRWNKLSSAERRAEIDAARESDNQVMRFGLASSMMGDGYFAYDAGTMYRGNWWWYPEYNAKVGLPLLDVEKQPDGTWRREFTGGTVIVNGTLYDTKVHFANLMEDVSTKRISHDFTLPMQDGRIYRPSNSPEASGPDIPLTFTSTPPDRLLSKTLSNGDLRFQLPSGFEAIIEASGMLHSLYYNGKCIANGGKTTVVNPPWKVYSTTETNYKVNSNPKNNSAIIEGKGSLTEGDSCIDYKTQITLGPGPVALINMQFVAKSDLNLQMWRIYFTFPVSLYQGASARQGNSSAKLPDSYEKEQILNWNQDPLIIDNNGIRIWC